MEINNCYPPALLGNTKCGRWAIVNHSYVTIVCHVKTMDGGMLLTKTLIAQQDITVSPRSPEVIFTTCFSPPLAIIFLDLRTFESRVIRGKKAQWRSRFLRRG